MLVLPLLLMLILIFLSMPVGFALGIAGIVGLFITGGIDAVVGILGTSPYRAIATFTLSTVPLYLLMAEFIVQSQLAEPLFDSASKWMGRIRGGLGIATILADAGFGAMSGSSTAAAATMGRIAYPEMKRHGYSDELSCGVVTVGGTLAIMIPPSIAMLIYGIATETSIAKLFIAGVIPGILMVFLYALLIFIWAIVKKEGVAARSYSMKEKLTSLIPVWPVILMVFVVIVCLYTGVATATEVGALGASSSLLIGLALKRLTWKQIKAAFLNTLKATAMINTIIIGAKLFGYYLTLTNFTHSLGMYIQDVGISKWGFLAMAIILYLLLGMVMDNIAILLLTLPFTFPLAIQFGFDPVWFGIICTLCGEIGLVTPPVGLNAYMVSAACNLPLGPIFRGSIVLLSVPIIMIFLIVLFPDIVLYMPSRM